MKKIFVLLLSLMVCALFFVACSEETTDTEGTSSSAVSSEASDESGVSVETSENTNQSDASISDPDEENSTVIDNPEDAEPVAVDFWTEEEYKKDIHYTKYDNGNIIKRITLYEDEEKQIRESETVEKDGVVLSETEYTDGENSKSSYFIDGELFYYTESFEVSEEESVYFGKYGTNTYDASNKLLTSHYGKSDLYHLENGEIYYLCYDDPSDTWQMWLYAGFTKFYDPQETVAEYLADEDGWYFSIVTVGDGYTEEQAEEIIKELEEYRKKINELSEQWQASIHK